MTPTQVTITKVHGKNTRNVISPSIGLKFYIIKKYGRFMEKVISISMLQN